MTNMSGQPVCGAIAEWILANVSKIAHDRELLPMIVASALDKWEPAQFIRGGMSFEISLLPSGVFGGKVSKPDAWILTETQLSILDMPEAIKIARHKPAKLADLISPGELLPLPEIEAIADHDNANVWNFTLERREPWYEYREKLMAEPVQEKSYPLGWRKND